MTTYFTVGIIAGPHALRGEVKVLPRTDFPVTRFKKGSQLWLRYEGQTPFQELTIASARPHQQYWLLTFTGFSSISDVEHWKGLQLCVTEEALVPLPDGTYYIHQLIGLDVVTDDGRSVGTLVEVLQPGANDVYVVRGPLQKQDVLLPAIPECVLRVDPGMHRMTVHLMPGLLEGDDLQTD